MWGYTSAAAPPPVENEKPGMFHDPRSTPAPRMFHGSTQAIPTVPTHCPDVGQGTFILPDHAGNGENVHYVYCVPRCRNGLKPAWLLGFGVEHRGYRASGAALFRSDRPRVSTVAVTVATHHLTESLSPNRFQFTENRVNQQLSLGVVLIGSAIALTLWLVLIQ